MRRRKSSCPNIEPRRTSATPNRSSMKLDLYIEDDELQTTPLRRNSPSPTSVYHDHHHHNNQNNNRRRSSTTNNIEDTAEEVLCLRLLSTRTRYRFGGLRVNLISPVFNMNKLFNVEFDQDSQISLIKSQQSSFDQQQQQQTPDMESFFRNNNDLQQPKSTREGRCATIVIEPESEEQKDEITRQLPLLTADLTLLEGLCKNFCNYFFINFIIIQTKKKIIMFFFLIFLYFQQKHPIAQIVKLMLIIIMLKIQIMIIINIIKQHVV